MITIRDLPFVANPRNCPRFWINLSEHMSKKIGHGYLLKDAMSAFNHELKNDSAQIHSLKFVEDANIGQTVDIDFETEESYTIFLLKWA